MLQLWEVVEALELLRWKLTIATSSLAGFLLDTRLSLRTGGSRLQVVQGQGM